jgi:hypothetical protein
MGYKLHAKHVCRIHLQVECEHTMPHRFFIVDEHAQIPMGGECPEFAILVGIMIFKSQLLRVDFITTRAIC